MPHINSIAWLRALADHAEAHDLGDTISNVVGYQAHVQVHAPWNSAETKLSVFAQWVASVRPAKPIGVRLSGGSVHLTVEGRLDSGLAVSLVTVLQGVEMHTLPCEFWSSGESTLSVDTLARLIAEHADAKTAA